ncbi:MAG TPA: IscS subfamily cysteine desulfurase, partial [Coxiellaceae bacterium]|nr:IscS subfamily cysteine desulfurase [Coxiellaceae bacterium]
CFNGMDAEALIVSLRDLAISSGSACDSATIQPSHVLMALGLSRAQANSSLRFSLGRFTTAEEIDFAIKQINEQVLRLQKLALR